MRTTSPLVVHLVCWAWTIDTLPFPPPARVDTRADPPTTMSEIHSNRPQSRDSKNPVEEPEITKFQELVSDDNQDGVRIAEAVALSWSKTSLTVVYVWYVNCRRDVAGA